MRYTSTMVKVKPVESLDRVVIRFAGDSGDGMQLTGDRFTSETAVFGNDLVTLPDFPAEIDRKSTRLNSSHIQKSRMPSSA